MRFKVFCQIARSSKSLRADFTMEQHLAGVESLVSHKVVRSSEPLRTVVAHVRFLTGVRLQVSVEIVHRNESFRALIATVRLRADQRHAATDVVTRRLRTTTTTTVRQVSLQSSAGLALE